MLITGLNSDTSRLNKDVAVNVAATLTAEVTAAAVTISAFGTGICISVPGRVTVVASASCGRSFVSSCTEGVYTGDWDNGCGIVSAGTAMDGTTGGAGFFS
jgi:hypothetical protein